MIKKLKGGNFDLDLCSQDSINWEQDPCPWNLSDNSVSHKCAVKSTSICQYFAGLGDQDHTDTVLCTYPENFSDYYIKIENKITNKKFS